MDATNNAQDDDDPPPFPRQQQTEGGESSRGSSTSPIADDAAPAADAAVKKEKGRVRFNSRAQDNPPPRSKSPVTPPAHELGDPFVPKPKPILRGKLSPFSIIPFLLPNLPSQNPSTATMPSPWRLLPLPRSVPDR